MLGRTQAYAKCAARGASAPPRQLWRPKSPRWRSSERSIATLLTHSPLPIVQIKPRASPSAATNGGERGEAGPVGTRGCRLDSARGVARPEPARPNRAPQRTPSARGGMASSLRSKPAPAVATRSHQRAARQLDMPSVSNAQSARQGRNRDNRSRRAHSSLTEWSDTGTQVRPRAPWDRGVSYCMSSSTYRVHVSMCVCLRRPAFPSSRGVGRARGSPFLPCPLLSP